VLASRKKSQAIGNWGPTTQIEKEKAGILVSFLDGASRKITIDSIYRHLIDLAIASYPVNAPPAKGRQPSKRFKRKPRPRTQNELRALARANEARRHEAQLRKEARKENEPAKAPGQEGYSNV
jgi:hypothetical protein